jgi:hypothetical protein
MSVKEFLKQAFCDNGTPSSSRLLTVVTVFSSAFALLYAVITTRLIPDGGALMGLGAYASSPYAVHRASKMFGKDGDRAAPAVVDNTKVVINQP